MTGDIYSEPAGEPFGDPAAEDPLKAEAQAAKDKLGGAVETVKGEAAHFAERAKEQAAAKADQGKEAVTNAIGDFAEAIRVAGEQLGDRDQTMAARLVSQAAEGLETLSRSVAEKRPEDMLNALRDFGRNNPTAFVAGAVLAGVALGRFARSSAEHVADSTTAAGPETNASDRAFARSEGFVPSDETAAISEAQVDGEAELVALDVQDLGVLGEDETDGAPRAPQAGL